MAYNCAEVVHFWSKHWKKKEEETMQSSQKQNYYKFIAFVL